MAEEDGDGFICVGSTHNIVTQAKEKTKRSLTSELSLTEGLREEELNSGGARNTSCAK